MNEILMISENIFIEENSGTPEDSLKIQLFMPFSCLSVILHLNLHISSYR
jgi:hypothetical protein